MAQESEEKRLPASAKKLREGRRKGQVQHSRDLISGFTLLAALGFLYFYWPSLSENIFRTVRAAADPTSRPFAESSTLALQHAFSVIMELTVPLVAIIVCVAVVFGMVATRGPVFSFEPLKPKFEHVNPATGLKRIFSLRNVIEFSKALAKTILLCTLLVALPLMWLQSLFDTPGCGPTCLGPMIGSIVIPLAVAAALAFVVIGLIDLPIQRSLFLRDMRMTATEARREFRDMEGDPQVEQERGRQRRESVSRPLRVGMKYASLAIIDGDRILGLRYVASETPVPVIVAKAQGSAAWALRSEAEAGNVPIVTDGPLADMIFDRARVGKYIAPESFTAVVRYLVELKLI